MKWAPTARRLRDWARAAGCAGLLLLAGGGAAAQQPDSAHAQPGKLAKALTEFYLRFYQITPNRITLQLREVARVRQAVGEHDRAYAAELSKLAALYLDMGRYDEAEPFGVTALGIRKDVLGEDHPEYGKSLSELAAVYLATGRHHEAEPLCAAAVEIQKQALGEKHIQYALALCDLSAAYRLGGRYADATLPAIEACDIARQTWGPYKRHPTAEYGRILENLADVYQARGRYADALALYFEGAGSSLGSGNKVAALQIALGNYGAARTGLATTRLSMARFYGKEHPNYARLFDTYAVLYEKTGQYADAVESEAVATTALLKILRNTFTGLSEREKQLFLGTITTGLNRYHSLLLKLPAAAKTPETDPTGTAYNNLLLTKGVLLASAQGLERQALASHDTALVSQFLRWQATRRQLAVAYSLPPFQQRETGLDPARLDAQANALEKALSARLSAFRQSAGLPTATWQQVQQQLQPGQAAIELVRYHWYRHRFTDSVFYSAYIVVPGGAAPQVVALRHGNDLETRALPAYRRLTRAPARAARGAADANAADTTRLDAQALYRAFWEPIARALPAGCKTVFLSADGAYQQINLATLQNPATGRYVLEETDIQLLGSTRELVPEPAAPGALPALPAAAGETVLVGAPAFRLAPARARPPRPAPGPPSLLAALSPPSPYTRSEGWLPRGEVPPLPGTAREISRLDSLLRAQKMPVQRFTGPAATEEAVRDVRHPRVLHIATHGFFIPDAAPSGEAAADPMLRSGVLLAGVSNFREAPTKPATEDGVLTAYEASLLDLHGTELVVLSACETGLGQQQAGEGVYGLQRGFAVAGARAVLMSLWKVDDAVTQELMVAFYRRWLGGLSKRAALLAAQQQIRQQHPDPYYWGPFILVGL